jgi:hypothetical protein
MTKLEKRAYQAAYMRAWRKKNPQRAKEIFKKSWDKYKNKYRRQAVLRYKKNPDLYRKKAQEWRKRNPDKRKNNRLKCDYGITLQDWKKMFFQQKGLCGICKGSNGKLVVDHCHSTKKIRGLLCERCNKGLGYFFDSKRFLSAAIRYLSK